MHGSRPTTNSQIAEPAPVRWLLIALAIGFVTLFLLLPLVTVFAKALSEGPAVYVEAIVEPYTLASIRLTIVAAVLAVPLNLLFGLAAAWGIARFSFPGRRLLVTLIDVPFSVSPVISGMLFILLFGAHGWLGTWLGEHDVRVVFALPGIVLVTVFVTSPFIARELIPILEAQGCDDEEAALTLGASGWQMFFRVSLPKIRWGLFYGIILCNARAMGEFGAVSVVSGHIRGETTTVPLHVEMLYNEYQFASAFAVATLLTFLALITLALKAAIERLLKADLH